MVRNRAKPKPCPPDPGEAAALAWRTLLNMVSRRERNSSEIRGRLAELGIPHDIAEASLSRANGLGFVDDERAAANAALSSSRNSGDSRVRSKMISRGFSREQADEAMERVSSDGLVQPEGDRAMAALLSKFPRKPAVTSQGDFRRAWSFLCRRGFPPSVAYSAVKSFFGNPPADCDGEP